MIQNIRPNLAFSSLTHSRQQKANVHFTSATKLVAEGIKQTERSFGGKLVEAMKLFGAKVHRDYTLLFINAPTPPSNWSSISKKASKTFGEVFRG